MRPLLFILMFLVGLTVNGQNQKLIDSLKKQLPKISDTFRSDLLNAIGWEYRAFYPDSTIYFAQQAYDWAESHGIEKGQAKSLNFIGVANNYKGDRVKAYDYYRKAIEKSVIQKDSNQLAYANNNIGQILLEQRVSQKSLDYFTKALEIFNTTHDFSGIAYVKQSLAKLYLLQLDYKKSEQAYLEALTIRKKLGKPRDVLSALVQIGMLYQQTNELDKSNRYFFKADSIGSVIHDNLNLSEIKLLLAQNYLEQGRWEEAEKIGFEGYSTFKKYTNLLLQPRALLLVGRIYVVKKQYDKAYEVFNNALKLSLSTKSSLFQMQSYFQLSELSKLTGRKMEEISNLNRYLILKDTMESLELAREVERLQFALQIQAKEKENDLLRLNQEKAESLAKLQRLVNVLSVVAIVALAVVAITATYTSKRRRSLNNKLALRNEQILQKQKEIDDQNAILLKRNQLLSDLNHERNGLMGIVAHDLKSPINNIKGLLSLVELEGSLNDRQREVVGKMKKVTQTGSDLITDLLDVNRVEESHQLTFSTFDLADFLNEKIAQYQVISAPKSIDLQCKCASPSICVSDSSYVHRIVDNLLSNAIKFSTKKSTVIVEGRCDERIIQIAVKDEGPGFSPDDKKLLFQKFKKLSARPTAGESSNGLGLAIVKILVDRLGGTIELDSALGKGSTFVVKLPMSSATANSQETLASPNERIFG